MNTIDPREQLMIKGNVLLDVMYAQHLWDQKYSTLAELIKKGEGADMDEIMAATNRPDFIGALLESLELSTKFQRTIAEYTMLRQTIEALEGVRPSMDTL